MAEPLTVKHVYELLRKYLNQLSDIGACKELLDCVAFVAASSREGLSLIFEIPCWV
jgi:hypothetical protein